MSVRRRITFNEAKGATRQKSKNSKVFIIEVVQEIVALTVREKGSPAPSCFELIGNTEYKMFQWSATLPPLREQQALAGVLFHLISEDRFSRSDDKCQRLNYKYLSIIFCCSCLALLAPRITPSVGKRAEWCCSQRRAISTIVNWCSACKKEILERCEEHETTIRTAIFLIMLFAAKYWSFTYHAR